MLSGELSLMFLKQIQKKFAKVLSDPITTLHNHDPCTHTCTNHSVPHPHLQPSLKSETPATIQTLNAASVPSPPSSTTTSRWNGFTTPPFISSAMQNNLSSPPYQNGKRETTND